LLDRGWEVSWPEFRLWIYFLSHLYLTRHGWLISIILATQEAEIGRIAVQSQAWQIVPETLSRKYPTQKRAGIVLKW
jgi:hypothetical protein